MELKSGGMASVADAAFLLIEPYGIEIGELLLQHLVALPPFNRTLWN